MLNLAVVRVRPLGDRELSQGCKSAINIVDDSVELIESPGRRQHATTQKRTFTFDKAYWSAAVGSTNYGY